MKKMKVFLKPFSLLLLIMAWLTTLPIYLFSIQRFFLNYNLNYSFLLIQSAFKNKELFCLININVLFILINNK